MPCLPEDEINPLFNYVNRFRNLKHDTAMSEQKKKKKTQHRKTLFKVLISQKKSSIQETLLVFSSNQNQHTFKLLNLTLMRHNKQMFIMNRCELTIT